jgi:ABC-type branched-subunit amino acid transport system substrate-binding protein
MASKRTTRTAVWLVLTIVLLTASITGGYYIGLMSSKPQEQQQEGLPEKIKVGVMLPLSGELGPIGIKMLNGAILAAKVANNTGGIGGRPIKIVAEDTLARTCLGCHRHQR